MPRAFAVLGLLILGAFSVSRADAAQSRAVLPTGDGSCDVTEPNKQAPPGIPPPAGIWHGNGDIWAGLWKDNTIIFKPGGPGFMHGDGSLEMKIYWVVRGPGPLTVEGRRLDAPSSPLIFTSGPRLDDGGNPSMVTFPSAGCWDVTAKANGSVLRFVTRVVRLAA